MNVEKKDLTSSLKIKNQIVLDRCQDIIREYREKTNLLKLEFNNIDIDEVVDFLTKKNDTNTISFTKYAEEWIKNAKIKGVKNYKSAVNSFKNFMGKDNVLFSDITFQSMKRYEDSLSSHPRAKTLYTNAITKIFNDARLYYNDEENDIIRIKNTLKRYTAPKQYVAKQRALSIDDILRIIELPYSNEKTIQGNDCRRDMAKDCFLLSFFLMGMNSADLYLATKFDGQYITYNRTKTKDRRSDNAEISVRVHPFIKPILDKYRGDNYRVFNFYKRYSSYNSFNKAINIGLKEIGKELNIKSLQFYSARHSMATIAANDVGISIYIVNDMLNHIEPSMKITKLYIKRDYTAINDANYKLIEYVLNKLKSPLR